MAIIRASQLADGATLDADICIVGAGAAGITLARALEESLSLIHISEPTRPY